jgi:hypothetical protein
VRPQAAKRKAKREESLAVKHRRAVDLGAKGKIGAMAGVYDAAGVMPATQASLHLLSRLFPRRFVPLDCPRRAALKVKMDELRLLPPVKLDLSKFRKAARTLPKSASTWASAHLLRCVAETLEGATLLKWLIERVLLALVPESLMGVLFDTKLVGLQKQSQMAADIEELASRAKKAHEAPAAEEAGEEVQTVAPAGAASAPQQNQGTHPPLKPAYDCQVYLTHLGKGRGSSSAAEIDRASAAPPPRPPPHRSHVSQAA